MPWSVFSLQAALFGSIAKDASEAFELAFGRRPTAFQRTDVPTVVSYASMEVDGRHSVVQAGPERLDLFAMPVQQNNRFFVPLPQPEQAGNEIEGAAIRLAGEFTNMNRIAWVMKMAHPVESEPEAAAVFAAFTGIDPARVGTRDNFFQAGDPFSCPELPDAKPNQIVQWRTENVRLHTFNTAGAPASAEHLAVTLNVDLNVYLKVLRFPQPPPI